MNTRHPVASFEWTPSERPTYAVVTALAELTGVDLTTVEPLNSVIDPEAMDALVSNGDGRSKSAERLEFGYGEYVVVLEAGGRGTIFGAEGG